MQEVYHEEQIRQRPQLQTILRESEPVLRVKQVYAPNIEVYYWGPSASRKQVGHLALRLIDDKEDIYISHWPKGQKTSFQFDMEDEGRGPDEYLLIPNHMIYADKVKQWWTRFLENASNGTENYNLLVNNCAQVVYRALRSGSFPHFFVFRRPMILPWEVKEWVKSYKGVENKKDKFAHL